MTPNRIVAVLTPLVVAPLAGACASWLSQHFPGIDVKQSDLQAIFIGGALIALAPAAHWLHGWQKHEARQADHEHAVELANVSAIAAQATELVDPGLGFEDDADLDGAALLDELGDAGELDSDLSLLVFDEEPTSPLR